MSDISTRVRWLIDRSHGGNVNAAARALGIPQKTLADLATGVTDNPHRKTVVTLATFYGASCDWILTGDGVVPSVVARCPHCRQALPEGVPV